MKISIFSKNLKIEESLCTTRLYFKALQYIETPVTQRAILAGATSFPALAKLNSSLTLFKTSASIKSKYDLRMNPIARMAFRITLPDLIRRHRKKKRKILPKKKDCFYLSILSTQTLIFTFNRLIS